MILLYSGNNRKSCAVCTSIVVWFWGFCVHIERLHHSWYYVYYWLRRLESRRVVMVSFPEIAAVAKVYATALRRRLVLAAHGRKVM